MQKKVLAINDISCVGRCSLTVALPIISAAKIECSILPTAILSTHTGGFTGFTFTDFTSEMMNIANHWNSLDIHFDSIYTGFLGSKEQISIVKNIVGMFKQNDVKVYCLNASSGHDPKILLQFHRVIKEFKPDLIHSHVMALMERIYLGISGRKIPLVGTIHGITMEHLGGKFSRPVTYKDKIEKWHPYVLLLL